MASRANKVLNGDTLLLGEGETRLVYYAWDKAYVLRRKLQNKFIRTLKQHSKGTN